MSREADLALAARDRALPGLALVLDDEAFAAALREALPEANVLTAQARYVRYKPGTSCLVAFTVAADGGAVELCARAHRPHSDKLDAARRRVHRASPLGPGSVVLDDLAVGVHVLPHDKRLRALRRLLDPERRAELLRRLAPAQPELWDGGLTPLRYNPERRWVGRLDGAGGARAVVRVHSPSTLPHGATSRALGGALPALPRLLGRSHRRHLAVWEWREGTSLDRLWAAGDAERHPGAAAAGALLAALHGLDARVLQVQRPRPLAERLRTAAEATWPAGEETALRAMRLAAALAGGIGDAAAPCPVHGDCSADQFVAGDGGLSLIDLDAAAYDDPTADLASVAADLEARVVRGELTEGAASGALAALLAAYAGAGGTGAIAGRALELRTAAALLLRAPEPFRRREDGWDRRTEAIVARAEALAGVGAPEEAVLAGD